MGGGSADRLSPPGPPLRPQDLQAFAHARKGRYWFAGGWNVPAVLAWLAGSVFGVLSVNTELVAGPLADIAGGIDVRAIGSGLVAALVYLAAGVLVPGLVDAPSHRPAGST